MSPKALLQVSIEPVHLTPQNSVRTLCGFMRALALLRDTYLELASGIENSNFDFRTHGN